MKSRIAKCLVVLVCISILSGLVYITPTEVKSASTGLHPTEGNYMFFENVDPSGNAAVDQYVDVGLDLHDLGISDVGTIEAWIKSEDVTVNRDPISDWSGPGGFTLRVARNIAGYVYPNDSRINPVKPDTIEAGKWHHVALVLNKDKFIGYVDGKYVTEVPLKNGIGDSDYTLKFGKRGDGGNKYWGGMSDVRVWNVARTEQEIKENKDQRLTGKEEGLVGYWKLDEAFGNIAIDSAGNHHGVLVNSPKRIIQETPVHPTEGNYVFFENQDPNGNAAVNQHIDFDFALADLGLTDTATIEAWVKSEDITVNRDPISDWAGDGFTLRVARNIAGYVYPLDSRINPVKPDTIEAGKWHHVALVLNKDKFIGYVDGQYITEVPLKGPIGKGNATFKLGMRGDGGNKYWGGMSDVRIWNVARTQQEIADNKDKKLTGTEDGLVAYYKLDEAAGDIAVDSVGNHHGKLKNGVVRVLQEAPSHPTKGYYLMFNNQNPAGNAPNDDHVELGIKLPDLGLTDVATVEGWFKPMDVSVNRDPISDWAGQGFTLRVTSDVEGYVYGPGHESRISKKEQNIKVGEWHHVAIVLDQTVMRGYVDGRLIQEVPLKGPIGISNDTLKFGKRGDDGNKYWGGIADVRIWNVARTTEEINAAKDKRLTGNEPGLVGYWKLDEASGDIAYDSAGEHHGTIIGAQRIKPEKLESIEIEQGDKMTYYKNFIGDKLTAKVLPENSAVTLEWTSSDPNVLTIDRYGVITGVNTGKATVTVKADGSSLSDSIEIEVKEYEPAKFDYSFIVFPDTQHYSNQKPEVFNSIANWTRDNAAKEKIKFMMHVGDISDSDFYLEWDRAKIHISKLDGVMPYILTVGNHDYEGNSKNRNAANFNKTFPLSLFQSMPTYGGAFEKGKADNTYHTMTIDGVGYLIMSLEFGPRNEVLDWANSVIEQYSGHRVIIVTHSYLNPDGRNKPGSIYNPKQYNFKDLPGNTINDGEDIWNKVASKHKNVFMVISGHISNEDPVAMVDTGVNGNKVIQVLADTQDLKNGGNGYLLLLRFDEEADKVSFNWFTPYENHYLKLSNQITLDIDKTIADLDPSTSNPIPTEEPSEEPSEEPTDEPTQEPTQEPTEPGTTNPGTGESTMYVVFFMMAIASAVAAAFVAKNKKLLKR